MFKIQNKAKIQISNTGKKKFSPLIFGICAYFAICSLTFGVFAQAAAVAKKVVMVIAHDGFRDEEFFVPKNVLEKGGVKIVVASSAISQAKGVLGAKVKPDSLVNDVNINEFDGIIFVGGVGATEYWDSPVAHKLARDAYTANKIVAAICIGPVILANAGILEGKKATVWDSEAKQLRGKGASYTGKGVERDGNIITANGPAAGEEFGEAILEALSAGK
jgi:protease I